MIKDPEKNTGYSYSFSKIRKDTFRQITTIGALVIFKLRQFLLQESIIFSLGATDEQGTLFERQISQDQLFQKNGNNRNNLRSSLSSKAIVLSKSLERYNTQDFEKVGNLNLWPSILQLAFEGPRIKDSGDDIDTEKPYYYQKDSADKQVYVRYTEGKRRILQYYYGKNEMIYFNRGWLYEWYMEYLAQGPEREQELQNSIKHQSISPIIKKMDAIPGYKGGDFITAEGQQMQAKYYNQQIITYTSIINVLKDIQNILSEWQKNKDITKMSEDFINLFTDENTAVDRLNQTYNKIVNDQLLSLLKT